MSDLTADGHTVQAYLPGVGHLPHACLCVVAASAEAVVAAKHSHISCWIECSAGVVSSICGNVEVHVHDHSPLIVI